jgi:hypothetical protein
MSHILKNEFEKVVEPMKIWKPLILASFTGATLCLADGSSSYDRKKINETPDLVQTCAAAKFYKGGGLYCGPVAVSDSLVWLIQKQLLSYPYSSPEDHYALVKTLAQDAYLKTDKHKGTGAYSLTAGLHTFLSERGVDNFVIKHTGWRACKGMFNDEAALTPEWIEENISGNYVQWLNIGWYRREKDHLYRVGGHWLTVVGYRAGKCYALDPSPRNGARKQVHRFKLYKAKQIELRGEAQGLPETSEGMLEIRNGMTLKSTADVCLIDSSVSLNIY